MKVWIKADTKFALDSVSVHYADPGGAYTAEVEVQHVFYGLLSVVQSRIQTAMAVPGLPETHRRLLQQALDDMGQPEFKDEP